MTSFPTEKFGSPPGILLNSNKKKTYKLPENPHMSRTGVFPRSTENATALVTFGSLGDSGLRQRRPLGGEISTNIASNQQPQANHELTTRKSSFQAPPKSSLSLGTAHTSTATPNRSMILGRPSIHEPLLPSTQGCWVRVYGIPTKEHAELAKEYFGSLGTVVDTRGSFLQGRRNWIALKFESPLQAAKAKSQTDFELTSGIVIGVAGIPDDDPILAETYADEQPLALFGDVAAVKRNYLLHTDGGLTEDDVLLETPVVAAVDGQTGTLQKRSCFEALMRWILRLDD